MPIRPATTKDIPAIAAILAREIRDHWAHFATRPPSVEDLAETWRSADPRHPWLVADEDGVVGFAWASPWKTREAYHWTVEVGAYVEPGRQHQGLGRALFSALLDALRQNGIRTVLAGIALPNPASVRLAESFGLVHGGTLPMVGFKHGAWRDVGYWTLHMGEGPPR